MKTDVRSTMVELAPLDMRRIRTVGGLIDAMSRCSFGARMLGETTATLTRWAQDSKRPIIIYEGERQGALYKLLETLVANDYFSNITTIEEYMRLTPAHHVNRAAVIGTYPERHAEAFFSTCREVIFINQFGQAAPNHVRDGYFPRFIPSDPRLIIPIIAAGLDEYCAQRPITVSKLVSELGQYGGTAAETAFGAQTMLAALSDPDTTVFGTFSGAMTIAKMGLLLCDMLDFGMLDYISSTGALMAHGLIEGLGLKHYKYDPSHSDELLAEQAINRVTDTLEPEENFDHLEEIIERVLNDFDGAEPLSPSIFHRAIGKRLAEQLPEQRGILRSAYDRNVPVCVPAFCDSEVGNDVYVENLRRRAAGRKPLIMDLERDTEILVDLATRAKKLAIFSVGGGVPRNNTQNVAPLVEIINKRLGLSLPPSLFSYGCRIDPTPAFYGNLSGCTYREGGSWRKFDLTGMLAEIHADATIVWPIILKYLMENLPDGRVRRPATS